MNKKIIALLLAAVMLFVVTACAKNEAAPETTEAEKYTDETTVPTESIGGVVYNPDGNDGSIGDDGIMPTEDPENKPNETQSASESEDNATSATEPVKEETFPTKPVEEMTEYEKYMNMSGEEQMAYYNTFESVDAFMEWFNAAKAEHDEKNAGIDIGDGIIDAEDLIGGNG